MSAEARARQLYTLVEHALDEEMTDIITGDLEEGLWDEAIELSLDAARTAEPPVHVPAELAGHAAAAA